jgi:hypothetical protein
MATPVGASTAPPAPPRIRVSGATVRVTHHARARAGRYELVLTRGSRRVARLTMVVR